MKIDDFYHDDKKANVRIHGNGFIQAELKNHKKMHIWTKDCPRQTIFTPIHNHSTPFHSSIIIGTLINIEFTVDYLPKDEGTLGFHGYQAMPRNEKDTGLEKLPGSFSHKQ